MRSPMVAALVLAAMLTAGISTTFMRPAEAHGGGHGLHGALFSGHRAQFDGGRSHGNDSYVKAASDERDKLLTTKLKSICRGC